MAGDVPRRGTAACLPADISTLTLPEGVPVPSPQVDDTLMACAVCGCDIWVGPKIRALHIVGALDTLCFGCALARVAAAGGHVGTVVLDPDRADRPRFAA